MMRMRLMRYTTSRMFLEKTSQRPTPSPGLYSNSPKQELTEEIQGFIEHVTSSLTVTHPSLKQIAAEQKLDLES